MITYLNIICEQSLCKIFSCYIFISPFLTVTRNLFSIIIESCENFINDTNYLSCLFEICNFSSFNNYELISVSLFFKVWNINFRISSATKRFLEYRLTTSTAIFSGLKIFKICSVTGSSKWKFRNQSIHNRCLNS
jgi:hypothetical protein